MKKLIIICAIAVVLFVAGLSWQRAHTPIAKDKLPTSDLAFLRNHSTSVPTNTYIIKKNYDYPLDPLKIVGKVDTTNWPIYTNTEIGFSIKYPPGWGIAEYSKVEESTGSAIKFTYLDPNLDIYFSADKNSEYIGSSGLEGLTLDDNYVKELPSIIINGHEVRVLVHNSPTLGREYNIFVITSSSEKTPAFVLNGPDNITKEMLKTLVY